MSASIDFHLFSTDDFVLKNDAGEYQFIDRWTYRKMPENERPKPYGDLSLGFGRARSGWWAITTEKDSARIYRVVAAGVYPSDWWETSHGGSPQYFPPAELPGLLAAAEFHYATISTDPHAGEIAKRLHRFRLGQAPNSRPIVRGYFINAGAITCAILLLCSGRKTFSLLLSPLTRAVTARRLGRVGKCAKCRYDRAGLAPSTLCPECGTPESACTNTASRVQL